MYVCMNTYNTNKWIKFVFYIWKNARALFACYRTQLCVGQSAICAGMIEAQPTSCKIQTIRRCPIKYRVRSLMPAVSMSDYFAGFGFNRLAKRVARIDVHTYLHTYSYWSFPNLPECLVQTLILFINYLVCALLAIFAQIRFQDKLVASSSVKKFKVVCTYLHTYTSVWLWFTHTQWWLSAFDKPFSDIFCV